MFEKFINALGLMLIFVSILFLTYITTKYIGRNSGRISRGKHLHIIEAICLGRDKYLYLIKAGNEYIVVSSSNKGIDMLCKIDINTDISLENAGEGADQKSVVGSFKEIIDKYYGKQIRNK